MSTALDVLASRRFACALGFCALAFAFPSRSMADPLERQSFFASPASGTARDLATGLAVNGALVWGLNLGAERAGPERNSAFASGSTAAAFTVAPILASRYGWKIGVPAYALAVVTGVGRRDDRISSEVLAGATLGVLVGHSVAHRSARARMPEHLYMGKRGLGLKFGF